MAIAIRDGPASRSMEVIPQSKANGRRQPAGRERVPQSKANGRRQPAGRKFYQPADAGRSPSVRLSGAAHLMAQESGAALDDAALLLRGQLWIDRQGQHFACRFLAGWKIARAVAEVS